MLGSGLLVKSKFLFFVMLLGAILVILQCRLLFSDSSIFHVLDLKQQIMEKRIAIEQFKIKNEKLAMKIRFLKEDPKAYEEHARNELGMKKSNEKYYQVVIPVN